MPLPAPRSWPSRPGREHAAAPLRPRCLPGPAAAAAASGPGCSLLPAGAAAQPSLSARPPLPWPHCLFQPLPRPGRLQHVRNRKQLLVIQSFLILLGARALLGPSAPRAAVLWVPAPTQQRERVWPESLACLVWPGISRAKSHQSQNHCNIILALTRSYYPLAFGGEG